MQLLRKSIEKIILCAAIFFAQHIFADDSIDGAITKLIPATAAKLAAEIRKDEKNLKDESALKKAVDSAVIGEFEKTSPYYGKLSGAVLGVLYPKLLTVPTKIADELKKDRKNFKDEATLRSAVDSAVSKESDVKAPEDAFLKNAILDLLYPQLLAGPGLGVVSGGEISGALSKEQGLEKVPDAKEESSEALSAFSVNYANSVPIAKVDIFSGYANTFTDSETRDITWLPHRLGILVSGASSVGSPTLNDYMSAELLSHDGGLINVYLPIVFGDGYKYQYDKTTWVGRRYAVDRNYLLLPSLFGLHVNQKEINSELIVYLECSGPLPIMGIKAIKTSLQSDTANASNASSIMPVGVAYYGIGFDGPIFKNEDTGGDTGGIDFEGHIGCDLVNKNTLNQAFDTNIAKTFLPYWGLRAKAYFGQSFSISVAYDEALGTSRSFTKPVLTFAFGYHH